MPVGGTRRSSLHLCHLRKPSRRALAGGGGQRRLTPGLKQGSASAVEGGLWTDLATADKEGSTTTICLGSIDGKLEAGAPGIAVATNPNSTGVDSAVGPGTAARLSVLFHKVHKAGRQRLGRFS